MKLELKDVRFEYTRASTSGGQHQQKNATNVKAIHVPTGLNVQVNGRYRAQNKKVAIRLLTERFNEAETAKKNKIKKAKRDDAIHNTPTIRTYDFKKGIVIDHRNNKRASLKDVLIKGKIDLLHE